VVTLVEHPHRRDRSGQRVHRLATLGQRLQKIDDPEFEAALCDQLEAELVELGRAWQASKKEQIGDFFVGTLLGEHLDRVAPILELPHRPIDQTDAAAGGRNAGQAWNIFGHFGHGLHFRD